MVFLVILILYSGWLMVNTAEHCTANHTTDHCQKGIQLHELHKKQCLSICPSLCYQQRSPKATEILFLQVVHKSLRSVGGAQAQRPDKEKPMVPKKISPAHCRDTENRCRISHLCPWLSSVVPQSIRRASKTLSLLSFRPPPLH